MKEKIFFVFVLSAFLIPVAYSLSITITEGAISEIGSNEFVVPFGMIVGSITFRLGNYTWPATEIWLVPQGTLPGYFKANNSYLELPENLTSSKCKTSIYYNSTYGFAFKILQTGVDGSFCGLAYGGIYDIIAKF